MTTNSLRKDHDLIEKVVSSMETTITLLKDGKVIPESILSQTIDFTKNFVDVCHHGKEEDILFPTLVKAGLPSTMGPIPVMIQEHQITKEIASKIEDSGKEYLNSGNPEKLIQHIQQYIEHVKEHLWKENNRLFMMADARLQSYDEQVEKGLSETENIKLNQLGKTREYYEKLVDDLGNNLE